MLGAFGGIRTPNLLIRSQMLYPLSYERVCGNCSVPKRRPALSRVPDGPTSLAPLPAEKQGFEPWVPVSQDNSLAVSPIRPLSHFSQPANRQAKVWHIANDRRAVVRRGKRPWARSLLAEASGTGSPQKNDPSARPNQPAEARPDPDYLLRGRIKHHTLQMLRRIRTRRHGVE